MDEYEDELWENNNSDDIEQASPSSESAYLRAENEDDDGYDPYSDRRSEAPLFEPDPWR